ncbi:MAG: hypothetical protein EOP60_03605 [Sphingomonadales bacterium]|nr:MAG: hypothetical protein EOP60_03605 [Sphingomonadales bacterium]
MTHDKIISIGLLSQRDLDRLGSTFTRSIPVVDDDMFADLLDQLDKVEASPRIDGIMLMRGPKA